jgi:hypothetical protein
MPEEFIVMKIGTHIVPLEPISTAQSQIPTISNTNITAFQIAEAKP